VLLQFSEQIVPEEGMDENDHNYPYLPMVDGFRRERDAYAHLVYSGVCAKGSVPKCYGWLQLKPSHIQKIINLPADKLAETGRSLINWKDMPPNALLIEYFPDAVRIDIDNVTEKLAEVAMRGMCDIHAAYVCHGDIHPRNILVLPDERIVWVDFNHSGVPCRDKGMCRQSLIEEAFYTWGCFYQDLVRSVYPPRPQTATLNASVVQLPDKRIGFRTWVGEL
jgi:hypothetical protein